LSAQRGRDPIENVHGVKLKSLQSGDQVQAINLYVMLVDLSTKNKLKKIENVTNSKFLSF